MGYNSFEELDVWKRACRLAVVSRQSRNVISTAGRNLRFLSHENSFEMTEYSWHGSRYMKVCGIVVIMDWRTRWPGRLSVLPAIPALLNSLRIWGVLHICSPKWSRW